MRRRINEAIVSGEAWASAAEKAVQYWPFVLWVLTMSGIGTWFASGWTAVSSQGWGFYPFVGVAFAFVVTGIAALGVYVRNNWNGSATSRAKQQPAVALEIVNGEDFTGKTVHFDGKHFINCTFKNSAIQYDGGAYQVTHCHRQGGSVLFTSASQEIARALPLLKFIGLMRDDAQGAIAQINLDKLQK